MAKRKRARLKWVVGSLVVLVGGGWGVMKVAEVMAARDVDTQASKLRKLGYPTTVEEFVARLPKDESQNAAPLYLKAIAEFNAIKKPSWPSRLANGDVDKEARKRLVREMEGVYRIVVQASELEHCTYTRDWSLGIDTLFFEFAPMKAFGKICAFRAAEAAEARDWRSALANLNVGMRVALHSYEPHLIAHLVGISTERVQLEAFEEVVAIHRGNPEFLREAFVWLEQLPAMPDHRRAYDFDIISVQSAVEYFSDPKRSPALYGNDLETWSLAALFATQSGRRRVESKFLHLMYERLANSSADIWTESRRWSEFDFQLYADRSLVGRAVSQMMPVYEGAPRARAFNATSRRMLFVALWVAEQRNELGTLPHQLPDEERFRDPWTGQRYVYIKRGEGFTIRSVGPNKVDDGGERTASGTRTDDIDVQITPVR